MQMANMTFYDPRLVGAYKLGFRYALWFEDDGTVRLCGAGPTIDCVTRVADFLINQGTNPIYITSITDS